MPDLAVVALAALLLEGHDLGRPEDFQGFRGHFRAFDDGLADLEAGAVVDREHAVELDRLAAFDAFEQLHGHHIVLLYPVLFPTGLDHCIRFHVIPHFRPVLPALCNK